MVADRKAQIFFELHSDNPREGPGSLASTRRAFSLLADLPDQPVIVDIGCGPGTQTLDLAHVCEGIIHAVDIHKPYLDVLHQKVLDSHLNDRVFVTSCDMARLPFASHSFHLVWAEGAIYIMGFAKGLRNWQRLLQPNGYIAVTEASWLRADPPEQVRRFWNQAYPAMGTIGHNLAVIQGLGYELVGHFVLPETDWWDDYYLPLEARIQSLRELYGAEPEALRVLEDEQYEIDLYRKYSDYYGYVFYLMRHPAVARVEASISWPPRQT